MIHTCNPSTCEENKSKSRVQGRPQLHSELDISPGYKIGYRKKIIFKRNKGKKGKREQIREERGKDKIYHI